MADNDLAYGDYHRGGGRGGGQGQQSQGQQGHSGGGDGGSGGERGGFLGDAVHRLKSKDAGGVSGLLGKLSGAVQDISTELAGRLNDVKVGAQTAAGQGHRFDSFAGPRVGNDVKWYVDGCGYFYAVSEAISHARESIWILDWWLSPELYLRRPPAKNEQYRLDRMLKAAADRGVQVNIIVYKEVEEALTLSSVHTKHALEALSPNIKVFRHPDHAPDPQTFLSTLKTSVLNAQTLTKLPEDTLKAVYGMNEDVILYWAHHEKLCIIDCSIAFMGGLDLCYGRWDTNQHSISDVHPENLDNIVFPGQDYNNARIMDFQDVSQPENNKLDRTKSSRMGWSDISISIRGPVLADLEAHFVQRWNFIYFLKYDVRKEARYAPIYLQGHGMGASAPLAPGQSYQPQYQQQQTQSQGQPQGQSQPSNQQQQQQQEPYYPPPPSSAPPNQDGQHYPPPPPGGPPHQSEQNFPPPPPGGPPQKSEQHYPPPPSGVPPHHQSEPYYPPPPASKTPQQSEQYYPPPPQGQPPKDSEQYYPPPPQGQHSKQDEQYYPPPPPGGPPGHGSHSTEAPHFPPPPGSSDTRGLEEEETRGLGEYERGDNSSHKHQSRLQRLENKGYGLADKAEGRLKHAYHDYSRTYASRQKPHHGDMACQLTRSCARWSNGTALEHSVQNAYISAIKSSQHFIYIENQFFITATGSKQKPVMNQIGAAIVERVLRAARAGQKYKVMVIIPSVPGFAGDLRDDSALGTRAIMEFQYNSINRGGASIMEEIAAAGFNPMDYIRFYNLRNYDRINDNRKLRDMERSIGITYESARREADNLMDPIGQRAQDGAAPGEQPASYENYQRFQREATKTLADVGRWDSVAECYMLHGTDIRDVPWYGDAETEMDAFVSEELYIHSKVLIADDRIVICGSANLNDRSQLGDHDSEIALVIEDQEAIDSHMDGQPWRAGKFAATLRRQLFRKHLGLVRAQDPTRPDGNFQPVGVANEYDYDSPEDHLVQDPLAPTLQNFWNSRARRNTDAFRKIFHPVPDDCVRTWHDYKTFYEQYFHGADALAEGKTVGDGGHKDKKPAKYRWGHVVAEEFAPGPDGVREMKETLSTIRGTLVEMPLMFLIDEDIAKEGLELNAITEPIYT